MRGKWGLGKEERQGGNEEGGKGGKEREQKRELLPHTVKVAE